MDPDETLRLLRAFIATWQNPRANLAQRDYDLFIERVVDLDRHMSLGRRPPTDWATTRR